MRVTWREAPLRVPSAKRVISGYLEAFDPDVLVQHAKELPEYVCATGIPIIKPEEVWGKADTSREFTPKLGIGVFEVLSDLFEKSFKFKPKYPLEVLLPRIPNRLALFWASVFGELPEPVLSDVNRHYKDALEIQDVEIATDSFSTLLHPRKLFPRRWTAHATRVEGNLSLGRGAAAAAFFMDASKVDDVVDYWNLRAAGKSIIPVPRQFLHSEELRTYAESFFKAHRRPWAHNPKHCDFARFIRSRNCTMDEMAEHQKSCGNVSSEALTRPFGSMKCTREGRSRRRTGNTILDACSVGFTS